MLVTIWNSEQNSAQILLKQITAECLKNSQSEWNSGLKSNRVETTSVGVRIFKVNSEQEARTKCFAVNILKLEILETT